MSGLSVVMVVSLRWSSTLSRLFSVSIISLCTPRCCIFIKVPPIWSPTPPTSSPCFKGIVGYKGVSLHTHTHTHTDTNTHTSWELSGTHSPPHLKPNYLSLWILPIQVLSHNKFLTPHPHAGKWLFFVPELFSVLIFAFAPVFLVLPLPPPFWIKSTWVKQGLEIELSRWERERALLLREDLGSAQHLHSSSQPSVIPVPGDQTHPLLTSTSLCMYKCMHAHRIFICIKWILLI